MGTFEINGPSEVEEPFSGGLLTGKIIPGSGSVNCNGEFKFREELAGGGNAFEDEVEGMFNNTEVTGKWNELSPAPGSAHGQWEGRTFATVQSSSGTVKLINPAGTGLFSPLEIKSLTNATDAGLPPSAAPVVGALSFAIGNVTPGGTIQVTIKLPPGSNPTEAYKWNTSTGQYELYPRVTISGNELTLELTDNDKWDQNTMTSGVIADPVIPVRQTTFRSPENTEGGFVPDAVAVDPSGNVWTADVSAPFAPPNERHNRIIEFNSEQTLIRRFGSEGTGNGQFNGIMGIATNASGDVYVTDSQNNRVQEFSPTGEFLEKFGTPGTGKEQLSHPSGIAVDSSGNVWVLNTWGVLAQEFSPSGTYITGFGSASAAAATGLAISGGNLYVTERAKHRVAEYSTAGSLLATFDSTEGSGNGQSNQPWGIASDPTTGNLYVSESGNNRVQKFSPAGASITTFGSSGSGSGQFSVPRGIAVGPSGHIYVADQGNNRLQEWWATP